MTYTFKLSSRLAHMWAPVCAAALAVAACTDGDMSSMSPFDQLGNGGSPAAVSSRVSPKAAVIETSRTVKFSADSGMTWTTSGGTISSDGTFSSSIAGSFLVVGHGKTRTDSAKVRVVSSNQRRALTISPREVQLAVGQSATFTAQAGGSLDLSWYASGGSLDKAGTYIAGDTPGTYEVIVSALAQGYADTAVVTVTPAARHIVQMVLAPAAAVVIADSSEQYVATAQYDDGSVGPAAVSFQVNGGGAIDSRGKFTAGETAGTYKVTATATDGSIQATAPVSVTVPATTTSLATTSDAGSILFSDDFSSGNLSKSSNGWSWAPVWVDVVSGFSKDGNVGHAARFTFKGTPGTLDTDDAWAELRFKIGTAHLKDLWVTYWIYYPSGQESVDRGPRFVHRASPGSNNNKFFMLFDQYTTGYLSYGAHTWNDGTTGNGYLMPNARIDSSGVVKHFSAVKIPWEIDADRGRWVKVEIHSLAASGPGAADGVIQYFRDGVMVVDLQNLTTWQNLGDNTFKEGYLLGWANSGFTETTFAYISNVTFSTARLSPTLAAASP
jgi:hypothetical protein